MTQEDRDRYTNAPLHPNGAITILPTDTKFYDSREPGDPLCRCSRCSGQILEGDVPIRAWPEDCSYEYRYHPVCLGAIA